MEFTKVRKRKKTAHKPSPETKQRFCNPITRVIPRYTWRINKSDGREIGDNV